MNIYNSHTLENGLRVVHLPVNSNVSYCGFIVNVGTRDELVSEYGMAHFIEHMIFKGTKKRKPHHIINRMESVGGEINAFTTKEETTIYSVFLEEYFERALELLTDMTFNSKFEGKEIEKEIDVILDEINSYEDSPSELIYDEFENLIFKNSPLGHNILGDSKTLEYFNNQKSLDFINKHYTTKNIVFFSTGKTKFEKIKKLTKKYLSEIPSRESKPRSSLVIKQDHKNILLDKNTSQTHVMIGSVCCDMYSPNKYALTLLNNILGGPGMNSRLNISLREKRGYVYNIESNLNLYTDTGLFSIYFGCDKKNKDKCLELIQKEFNLLKEKKLSTNQLAIAKKQIIGQIAISSENQENLALALGKNYLHFNHINSTEEIITKINDITDSDILSVANETFIKNKLSTLIFK